MMKPEHTNAYLSTLSHRDIALGFGQDRSMRLTRPATRGGRFVTQSHVLGAPFASPASLAIAAAVAVALVFVTRRLTH